MTQQQHAKVSNIGLVIVLILLAMCLGQAITLSAQTCPRPMTLRQESCSAGLTTCSTKGDELEYQELDFDLLNTLHLCNTVGLYTWPAPSSGILSSNGSGIISIISDDDNPDFDAEVPDSLTISSGNLGPLTNTLTGPIRTIGLTNEPGQANLGASPRFVGVADGSGASPISDNQPTLSIQRWDANGSGGTSIGVQVYCNHTNGSGYNYCNDTFMRDNSAKSNDVTGKSGRVLKEPFGLVQGLGATPSASGGTLATNTYSYYVSGIVSSEEILGSQHVSANVTGPTGSVSLTWTALAGAASYKVYRYIPSSPSTSVVWFAAATNSFTDTGGAGTAGIGLSSTGWGGWFLASKSADSSRLAAVEAGVSNDSSIDAPYRPDVVGSTIGVQIPSASTTGKKNSIGLHITGPTSSFRRAFVMDGGSFSEYGIDGADSLASAPLLRLANTQDIVSKNAAGTQDVHVLEVDSSNFIRMGTTTTTIDPTNQRFGIITTSPDERLEIEETANASTIGLVQNLSNGSSAIAIWRAESDGALIGMQAHGSGRVASRFGVTVANYGEILQTTGNGLLIGTSTAAPMIFGTGSSARMTINGDGSIDIPQMSVPSNPSSGIRRLFVDSSTGKLSVRTSGGSTVSLEESGGGGGGNSFTTLDAPNGTDPVADSTTDTLLLTDGDGITITGDSTADSLTISRRDPLKYVDLVEEFCGRNTTSGVTGNFNWSNYGSNTPGVGIAEASHPCILSMFTTTTSGNVQAIGLGKNSNEDNWKTADHLDRMTWVIKTDTVITNAEIRVGFMDDLSTTTGGDGFFVEYDPAVNGFWRCVTRQGGTTTTNNSAVTVATSTWYQIELDQDGSGNLRCYVNNTATPFATNSTNKPTGTLNMGLVLETTNTTGKTVYYDFFRLKGKSISARF